MVSQCLELSLLVWMCLLCSKVVCLRSMKHFGSLCLFLTAWGRRVAPKIVDREHVQGCWCSIVWLLLVSEELGNSDKAASQKGGALHCESVAPQDESFPADPLLHYPAWVVWGEIRGEGADHFPGHVQVHCACLPCKQVRGWLLALQQCGQCLKGPGQSGCRCSSFQNAFYTHRCAWM